MKTELDHFRKLVEYLWDDNQEAFNILYFLKSNYKAWPQMLIYLKDNKLTGQKLVDFFKNESPDGGGYHMGATFLAARIKGQKFNIDGIKIDELI